jgi:hypothetical protein
MDEEINETRLLANFEKHGEFLNYQKSFLALDLYTEPNPVEDKHEFVLLGKLSDIVSLPISIRCNTTTTTRFPESLMNTRNNLTFSITVSSV